MPEGNLIFWTHVTRASPATMLCFLQSGSCKKSPNSQQRLGSARLGSSWPSRPQGLAGSELSTGQPCTPAASWGAGTGAQPAIEGNDYSFRSALVRHPIQFWHPQCREALGKTRTSSGQSCPDSGAGAPLQKGYWSRARSARGGEGLGGAQGSPPEPAGS